LALWTGTPILKLQKIFIPLQKILNAEDKYIVNFPATLGKEALLYNRMSLTVDV